jgi:hypothetical protein
MVMLSTESYNPSVLVNIIVLNVTDIWGNTITAAAKTIITTVYPEFPISINIGGNAALGYLADQEWDESLLYGYLDSGEGVWPSNTPIANTDEDIIYTTDGKGTKKYLIKVPNQQYDVTLMFAEKYFAESDKRIFDIKIENDQIAENFEIYPVAGKNTAYNITSTITVEDELLEIYLSPQIDQVVLSGIKVNPNPTSVGSNGTQLNKFELYQNYPNPFNPSTEIGYRLQSRSNVKLKIYDILGNEIATLVNQTVETGNHRVSFDQSSIGSEMVSGVYFYQLQTENFIDTKKMLLLK